MVELNQKLPAFSAEATSETSVNNESIAGKNVVFYFYPKDNTPGCTTEGQDFRDAYAEFESSNTIIFGISAALCGIPFLFVYPLFLLGYPILLFENANAIDAISKTFNIAKENYGTFLGAGLLGGLISISGIVLCCIGIIATFPFIMIVMYSLG